MTLELTKREILLLLDSIYVRLLHLEGLENNYMIQLYAKDVIELKELRAKLNLL
jgi:hypothetical protein